MGWRDCLAAPVYRNALGRLRISARNVDVLGRGVFDGGATYFDKYSFRFGASPTGAFSRSSPDAHPLPGGCNDRTGFRRDTSRGNRITHVRIKHRRTIGRDAIRRWHVFA